MEHAKILVERQGDVGVIVLNDPANLNALSHQSIEELSAAFDVCAGCCRAIVLMGEGRAFCSGAKLKDDLGEDLGLILETHINPFLEKLRQLPVPWITAVRGPAAGAGCAIALCADLIIASESAYFLQAFVRIGLIPDSGSFHLLVRSVGRVRALEMMMLGEKMPASQALAWGLINRIVADEALKPTAIELAQRLASGPTRTLGAIRQMAWRALDWPWPAVLDDERRQQDTSGRTIDAEEGINAFLEKRPPKFIGA